MDVRSRLRLLSFIAKGGRPRATVRSRDIEGPSGNRHQYAITHEEQEEPLEDWWEAHMASLPERVQYGGKKSWRIAP